MGAKGRPADRAERVANCLATIGRLGEVLGLSGDLERWVRYGNRRNVSRSTFPPAVGAVAVAHEDGWATRLVVYGST